MRSVGKDNNAIFLLKTNKERVWKVSVGILSLRRWRIQSGARDEAWLLRAFVQESSIKV